MDERLNNKDELIKKLSESLYHESILTSFIKNLDTVIIQRFDDASENASIVEKNINSSINTIDGSVNNIKKLICDGNTKINVIEEHNTAIIKKLDSIGSDINSIQKDVNNSVEKITGILHRFSEVQSLTGTIAGIAKQTNILSINAAIEAARSGEHGKGFAVVAEEVKKLAAETNTASKNISEKINSMSGEVQDVLKIVNYLSKLFSIVGEETKNSLSTLESNIEFIKNLVSSLDENKGELETNVETLKNSKNELTELVENIKTVDKVMRTVLDMQNKIQGIKLN